jgi:hypothetical protein
MVPEEIVKDEIKGSATEAGFNLEVNLQNLCALREQLLYFWVIEKRKA